MDCIIREILLKCNNWIDFESELALLSKKQKGDCFEILTQLFLKLQPSYATKLSHVWLLKEVPADIKKHLNLPHPDEGIDIVAETKDNKYWAIQCKYLSGENKSLTRNRIITFTDLSFTVCHHIAFALVCTSAIRYSHKLSMYGERLGFCSGDTWTQLDSDFFKQLHEFLRSESRPKISPAIPRNHQKEAIEEAGLFFIDDQNLRGKLIMPCGTGKCLTSYWIADRLGAMSVLVAVPSLALVRQSLEVWTRESVANKRDINWICVCSDETVSEIEKDDSVILTQDLGIQVHTNPVEIAEWLNETRTQHTVVFSTYQSGRAISEAAKSAGITFDLGIMDEAHKTVGKTDSLFNYLLHDNNISIKKRIFMTATERRYLGQSEHIASMDDQGRYGEIFYLLSFKAALESDPPILSDYRIVTMIVDKSEISDLIKQNILVRPDKGTWNEEVEAEMLASAVALRKAMNQHPIKHAVSFHRSISRAKAFKVAQDNLTGTFPGYGELATYHVSGKTPTGTRVREIESFTKANRSLITNARCLTEGVDIPSIDCVLFADPRKSTVDIVQAVGRALRPAPGKQLGYVIVPILIDKEASEIDFTNSAFTPVLTVLRALAANDDRIIEYFRSISIGRKATGGVINISIDIPDWEYLDAEKFIKSIELHFWSRLAKLAWRPFEQARAFVHGLQLTGQAAWREYCKGGLHLKGSLPMDIPAAPYQVYRDGGWFSWGDWLGTGRTATRHRQYLAFEEAREYVRGLGLKSQSDWNKYCWDELPDIGNLPEDIPANPWRTYQEKWVSMGDWLGTGTIAPRLRQYRPFEVAREFAHNLGLKDYNEWWQYCRGELSEKGVLPDDIPMTPSQVYKEEGWTGIGDWLGTGSIATFHRQYRPFGEARDFVRRLELENGHQWNMFIKGQLPSKGFLPKDIPMNPKKVYEDEGWINLGDWLGTGYIAPRYRRYLSFEEARMLVRKLGLKSMSEWNKYCQGELLDKGVLPINIPRWPNESYEGKGWNNWGDWLGTGIIAPRLRQYRLFNKAKEFVRNLCLKNEKEWRKFCKGQLKDKGELPEDIPANPNQTYKEKGWKGMGDWLGTGYIAPQFRQYRSYDEARDYVRSLGLKNQKEWIKFCKGKLIDKGTLPKDVPAHPYGVYKGEMKGMGDWLGTYAIANRLRKYRPFGEARAYVRSLRLRSQSEWQKFCKGQLEEKGILPLDIPANPSNTYKGKGWKGVGDWLGTGIIATYQRQYRTFQEARAFVHLLGLKSEKEWRQYCKGELTKMETLPRNIPASPAKTYKGKGWKSMGDWLGTGYIAPRIRQYLPFEEAREFVHKIGLTNEKDWRLFCKGLLKEKGTLPEDIPAYPNQTYKTKGWSGMRDWLASAKDDYL